MNSAAPVPTIPKGRRIRWHDWLQGRRARREAGNRVARRSSAAPSVPATSVCARCSRANGACRSRRRKNCNRCHHRVRLQRQAPPRPSSRYCRTCTFPHRPCRDRSIREVPPSRNGTGSVCVFQPYPDDLGLSGRPRVAFDLRRYLEGHALAKRRGYRPGPHVPVQVAYLQRQRARGSGHIGTVRAQVVARRV